MRFIIQAGALSAELKSRVIDTVNALSEDKRWLVQIQPYNPRRSTLQNNYLHAVPLKMIAEETGHTVDDIKDYLLGEYLGWEVYEILGKKKQRPVKRSSDLTTVEMVQFCNWIESWAATNLGMIIPKPNEIIT